MLFYIRRMLKNGMDPGDPAQREKCGVISGVVGVLLNLLLFAGKLIAALATGSAAVIADAFNNLSDAGSSVVTLVGFKLSGKKPDPEHPFGHGRFEYITGFVVSIAIIIMGFQLAINSVKSINDPRTIAFSVSTVVILGLSVVVKLYMALYNNRLYRLFDSAALKATALDSLSDALSTLAVLAALLVTKYTSLHLDGYAGLLVSVFILYSGIMAAKETLAPLLGQRPKPELVSEVERLVLSHPTIVGMHDLVVHDYGPGRLMISLHAEISADINVFDAHCIIDDMENELNEKLGCEAVIHFDPIDTNDERLKELREKVGKIVRCVDEGLTIHDFRYVPGESHTNLLFDVVVPFSIEISDGTLFKEICALVGAELPNHNCVIKFDRSRV